MNNQEEGLYLKILVWAYKRQESGFTWGNLEKEFSLTLKQKEWVQKIFRSNTPQSENLIDHLSYVRYPFLRHTFKQLRTV
jgi:hypothetical protein